MAQLTLRVLGALELSNANHPITHFRSDKIRALLVYLALESGRPHQRRSLAGLLWPELSDRASLRNLRKALFYLRQTIDQLLPQASDALLVVDRKTVQLELNGLTVDAIQFEKLLVAVERHSHRHLHLCQHCLEQLGQAAALYQGELLAGFSLRNVTAFEEWLLFQRERLHQQVISALGKLAAANLERRNYEQALIYATRRVGLDPFQEEAHRQIMHLLALDGQYNKALARYESCRRLLRDELGVEPARETVDLYRQIQAAQRGVLLPEPIRQTAVLHYFPAQFTPFIGRETELKQIKELFLDPECRLLTLVGPGGMGKTRLSIRAAEMLADVDKFLDGIYFFPLAGVNSGDALLLTLITGLDVALSAKAMPKDRLLEHLQRRHYLLVLDNFEHLVGCADLLVEMLAAAPGLHLLVSSHLPLQLQAEKRLTVSGLSYPTKEEENTDLPSYSAVRLFAESARYADATFELNATNIKAVLQICRFVQGMPLALELAAAWTSVMDCGAIAREIWRNLDFLSLSPLDMPDRHQSMTAVFAYTWALLEPSERAVLGQLAIFQESFSLKAAVYITGATPLTLARLLDKSLLQRLKDGRYALHQMLRLFFDQQTGGPEAQVMQRYSDYYLDLVAEQEDAFLGAHPRQAVVAVQREIKNIRHAWKLAIERGHWSAVKRSFVGLGRFYQIATLIREGETVIKTARQKLAETKAQEPLLEFRLMLLHAYFLHKLGRHIEALQLANQALKAAGDDNAMQAEAQSMLGQILPADGKSKQAIAYLRQAIAYYQTTAELAELAKSLRRMVLACMRGSAHDEVLFYAQQAIPLHQALAHKRGLAQIYNVMAGVYFERDDLGQALVFVEKSQGLYEAIGDILDTAVVTANLASLYSRLGQFEKALNANQRAIDLSQGMGDSHGLARDLSNRGSILATVGKFDESLVCYYRALDIEKGLGNESRIAYFQAGIAAVYQLKGDEKTALSYYESALPMLRMQANPFHLIGPLLGNAELQFRRGEWDIAQQLNEEASKQAMEMGLPEYIFKSRLLSARLAFKTGDKATAQRLLEEMLAKTEEQAERAELYYEMWQMTQDKAFADAALSIYIQVFKKIPSYINKARLNELEALNNPAAE